MQTKDHLALGHFLLQTSGSAALHRHARAFLLGCVEPDYNMATYMRGSLHHQRFRGHNAENSFAHVEKCMGALEQDGLCGTWDYFTLGTMLHYVADAFTAPHNAFWAEGLLAHAAYESKLHSMFSGELKKNVRTAAADTSNSPLSYFRGAHEKYNAASRDMKTDCRYIMEACKSMLLGSLRYTMPIENKKETAEGRIVYEGAYYNGLVQAGH